jgi:hypothetical protein
MRGLAVSSYCTCRSQSWRDVYGLRSHDCNSWRKSRAFALPMNSCNRSSACPALPLISTVRKMAIIYSSRNSALFARRFASLCSPGLPLPPAVVSRLSSAPPSGFKNSKTCSSRRIHLRARETSSSSRLKSCGVNSRYRERRFEPTRREKS